MNALVAGVKSFPATVQTNHIAWFWQPSFIDPWIDIANQFIFEQHLDRQSPPEQRSIYALVTVAQHDATHRLLGHEVRLSGNAADPGGSHDSTVVPDAGRILAFPPGTPVLRGAAAGVLAAPFPTSAASLANSRTRRQDSRRSMPASITKPT